MATKKGGSKIIEGVMIGTVLGIAAGLFAASKTGKKIAKDVKNQAADFYRYLAPRIKKAKKMSEAEYKAFVKNAMVKYQKDKKLSVAEARHLLAEVQKSWGHLKKGL